MRTEDFTTVCEKKAIRFFTTNNLNEDPSIFQSKAEEIAREMASKRDDFVYFYDIALASVLNVFRNPSRFCRLLKTKNDEKKEQRLMSFMGISERR